MFHLDVPLNLPSLSSNLGILNDDLKWYRKVFFYPGNHEFCPGEVWSSKGWSNWRPRDMVAKRSQTCCSKLPDAAFWVYHSSSFGASPHPEATWSPPVVPGRRCSWSDLRGWDFWGLQRFWVNGIDKSHCPPKKRWGPNKVSSGSEGFRVELYKLDHSDPFLEGESQTIKN